MKKVRAHVTVDGRVQGVCFRMDTRSAAMERDVKGWVRNMPDGRVEAVFEGDESNVKSLLKWFDTAGPPLARIGKIAVEWEPYTGEFGSFNVTYK